ncbi:MAG: hypothetical protein RL591_1270 [Planctomycetota bacterium]
MLEPSISSALTPPSLTESHAVGLLMLGLLLSLASGMQGCASPDLGAKQIQADSTERDLWHAKRLQTLAAEDGWLTLVGLDFLEEGEHTIGTAPTCSLRYQGATAPQIGTFIVTGDDASTSQIAFRTDVEGVTIDSGINGGVNGGIVPLVIDDRGTPSVVRNGSLAITAIRRNGALALRVKDNATPARTQFRGIELFPFDASLVVEAEVVAPAAGETIAITNVTGFVESQAVVAHLRSTLRGNPIELIATAGTNGRLFVVFADSTNGRESYGGGRFLDIPAPVDGKTTIDFNRATNPPCAFTPFATCPMPPAQNRLPLEIRAGERAPTK